MVPSYTNGHVSNGKSSVEHNGKIVGTFNAGEKLYTYMTLKKLVLILFLLSSVLQYYLNLPFYLFPVILIILFLPVFVSYLGFYNFLYCIRNGRSHTSKIYEYVEFLDQDVENKFKGKFIPIRDLYELYADKKINFRGDVLACLEQRNEYVSYKLQWWHLEFFVKKFLPELLIHSKSQDREQICEEYQERGNDFHEAFLGPSMVYTSGIRYSESETLEDIQINKIKGVCEKIQLKNGERHLDLGCGWGTFVNYAAEHYGTMSEGVTLAKNQVEWAEEKAKEKGVMDRVKYLCMDYRDIPKKKYDKITCFEMSEHVGIRLYPNFLEQVYNMLEDEGIFFLQIAGLRRAYQWEDFLWGFFMDTYIFSGADASLPLTFPVAQLESVGFEVESVKTIGVHYSDTIKNWYYNWIKPEKREKIIAKYGERIVRIYDIFLSWSTIIARQGNSTCYQIVAHKNFNEYPRRRFMKN